MDKLMAEGSTQKQENFCLAYIECGNASEAYRRAYDAEYMKPETVRGTALTSRSQTFADWEQKRICRVAMPVNGLLPRSSDAQVSKTPVQMYRLIPICYSPG